MLLLTHSVELLANTTRKLGTFLGFSSVAKCTDSHREVDSTWIRCPRCRVRALAAMFALSSQHTGQKMAKALHE